jgi:hypothetical protein
VIVCVDGEVGGLNVQFAGLLIFVIALLSHPVIICPLFLKTTFPRTLLNAENTTSAEVEYAGVFIEFVGDNKEIPFARTYLEASSLVITA